MSTEKLNDVDDLRTYHARAEVLNERLVLITGSSPYEPALLDIAEARALYEWLGKALPEESK